MSKLSLKIAAVSLIASLVLSGCSSNGSSGSSSGSSPGEGSGEKVTLRMSIVAGADEMPGWQGMVDAFNNAHPDTEIKLERLPGGWGEYVQKMTAQIAAGDPPDIGRLGVVYMPMFSSKGQLEDLTPHLGNFDKSQYYASALEQYDQNGQMFGMPTGVYTMAMYYNKDMLEEAGIPLPSSDWNEAWTFDELREAASKLTKGEGPNKQYGVYVNLNPERAIQYLWSNGGGILNEDRSKSIINAPESKEALSYLQSLIQDGYSPTPADTQTTPVDQLFQSGKLGMLIEGTWMMPGFSKIDSFEWGVAPIPVGATGQPATPNFVDAYVVYKGSKHVKEATEALKFFVSEEAENILVDNNIGGIPVLKSVADARKVDMFEALSLEEKEVWFQSVEISQALPFTSNWQELMDTTMKKLDLVGFGRLDAGQAADELAVELDKMLE